MKYSHWIVDERGNIFIMWVVEVTCRSVHATLMHLNLHVVCIEFRLFWKADSWMSSAEKWQIFKFKVLKFKEKKKRRKQGSVQNVRLIVTDANRNQPQTSGSRRFYKTELSIFNRAFLFLNFMGRHGLFGCEAVLSGSNHRFRLNLRWLALKIQAQRERMSCRSALLWGRPAAMRGFHLCMRKIVLYYVKSQLTVSF